MHRPAIPSVFMQPPRPAATCSSTSLGGIVAEAHFYAGTPRDPIANLTAKLRAAVLLQRSAEGVFRAWARHEGCLSRVDFHGFVQALGLAHPIETLDAIFVVADKQASRAILFPHHCRTPLFAPHCFPQTGLSPSVSLAFTSSTISSSAMRSFCSSSLPAAAPTRT